MLHDCIMDDDRALDLIMGIIVGKSGQCGGHLSNFPKFGKILESVGYSESRIDSKVVGWMQ